MNGTRYGMRSMTAAWRDSGVGRRALSGHSFLKAMSTRIDEDHLTVVAAGVAFYGMLAIFPALAAMVAIYGLLLDPAQVGAQIAAMAGMLPADALQLLVTTLDRLSRASTDALGLGAAVALAVTWWSASAGVRALMGALNVAYDVPERRGFIHRAALSLLLTLGAIVGGIVAIAGVVLLPPLLEFFHLAPLLHGVAAYARWPIVAAVVWFGVLVLYRFGPDRRGAPWSWRDRGAALAIVLWLAGSAAFSLYVRHFADYDATYGSIGAPVILLMWFLLSSYAILLGAELNAELALRERSTRPAT
jgi:membrane protein